MGKRILYGVESLPEHLRNFTSYAEAYQTLHVNNFVKFDSDKSIFAYVFPDGSMCVMSIDDYRKTYTEWEYIRNISEVPKNYAFYSPREVCAINFLNSVEDLLKKSNPYGYEFAVKENVPFITMLSMPKLEQLKKAGYAIADTIIGGMTELFSTENFNYYYRNLVNFSEMKMMYRIFHKGTSLYDIISFPKDIAKEMKSVDSVELWDTCRKLNSKKMLDVESLRLIKEMNWSNKDILKMYSIIIKEFEGKNYFTVGSLLRYLRRLDMYEAIPAQEALVLISDYIRCCHSLNVKPRFDSDSLKREHDVMARNLRIKLNEEYRQKQLEKNKTLSSQMKTACDKLHKYDYKEDVFFIRSINDFADLLDEANQQANCVASYAESIARENSKIFVMRETSHPDKSLITVELSPDNTLRQKYLSHNRPIHNKAQSDFIGRWLKHVQSV